MNNKTRLLFLGGVLLLLSGSWLFFTLGGPESGAKERHSHSTFESPPHPMEPTIEPVSEGPTPIVTTPFSDVRPPLREIGIEVVSTNGTSIVGAYVYWMAATLRAGIQNEADLRRTGTDGRTTIAWEGSSRHLVVYHPDFESASIENPSEGQWYRVSLDAGHRYRAQFKARSGAPLSGVTVRISPSLMNLADRAQEPGLGSFPGSHRRGAVRTSCSDDRGEVIIGGIIEGTHHIICSHPAFLALDIDVQRSLAFRGDVAEEVTMAPVYAAVVNVTSPVEDILGCGASHPAKFQMDDPRVGPRTPAIWGVEKALRKRFQSNVCVAMVLTPEAEIGGVDLETDITVVFAKRIPQSIKVRLHRVDTIHSPLTVNVDPTGLSIAVGQITATVSQPDGSLIPIESLLLRPISEQMISTTEMKPDTAICVPVGNYELGLSPPMDYRWLVKPKVVSVETNELTRADIRFSERVFPVQLSLRTPFDGFPISGVYSLEDGRHSVRVDARRDMTMFLPEGAWTFKWELYGLRSGTRSFGVGATEGQPLKVEVVVDLQ